MSKKIFTKIMLMAIFAGSSIWLYQCSSTISKTSSDTAQESEKEAIRKVAKRNEPIKGYIPAAVLLLFFEKEKQSHLVYIRRTQGMNIHSGHMAFPGGKIDPGDDSSFATATREACEEIGVDGDQYTYLGEMGFFDTLISSHDAAAHFAWCPAQPKYKINDFEVAEIVEIPLDVLFEQFQPDLDLADFERMKYLNFRYSRPGCAEVFNLWGLTARITHHFLQGVFELLSLSAER